MKRLLIILLVCCTKLSFAQILQPHTNFGDRFKRIGVDSTFLIPTFCGVPTLRGFLIPKRGALAFDSCNNRLYVYNPKTAVWDSIKGSMGGGGATTDTQYLRRDINLRVKFSDTASMLSAYQNSINGNTSQITANTAAIQQRVRYTDTASMLFPYTLKNKTFADSSTQRQALRDSAAAIRAASAGSGGGAGWGLTGNAGTTASNFIGTTDTIDLILKRNSIQSAVFEAGKMGIGPSPIYNNGTYPSYVLNVQGGILAANSSSQYVLYSSDPTSSIIRIRKDGVFDRNVISSNAAGDLTFGAGGSNIIDGNLILANGLRTVGIQSLGSLSINSSSPQGGSLILRPIQGSPAFINFIENGAAFWGSLGVKNGSGDLVYYTRPTQETTFDGTEIFRIVNNTGNFLVGTPTDIPTSKFTISSTNQGFLAPRMTTTQRNAIASPANGLQIYNTTTNTMNFYNGTEWRQVTDTAAP